MVKHVGELCNILVEMKKITLITQYFRPEMGAPQNRLYELAKGLQYEGWDVSVITGMPNYPTGKIFAKYRRRFYCKEVCDGIEVLRYWLYASNSKRAFPRIINMISFSITVLFSFGYLFRRKTDILIVESPPLILGISGWILSRLTRTKFIFNVSDLWPLSAKELGALSDGMFYKFLERIECFLYKRAQLCMGQSSEIVHYIEEHGAKNVYLFRNGVDPTRFHGVQVEKEPGNTLVYAGLLGIAQGVYDLCLQVDFKKIGVTFHIYGEGGEKCKICDFLKKNPNRNIIYHGAVSREDIPSVLKKYSASLILLVKNIFGAVPSKIYESMAAGLPIFFSGEGETVSIIQENNIGWVSPAKNYCLLEGNIIQAFKNTNEFSQKRACCIKAANESYNRCEQIKKLSSVLEKI